MANISNNPKFLALSEKQQKQVIEALNSGRVYLTEQTNATPAVGNIHYCLGHTGKMKNVVSVSTAVIGNPICEKRRQVENSICAHCFAAAQMQLYKNMQAPYVENLNILSTRLLAPAEIPVILSPSGLFRIESFGDTCTTIQAANYLRICEANPWLTCAGWTKNPHFFLEAIKSGLARLPKNLSLVLSSEKLNEARDILPAYKDIFHHVFTVFDKGHANETNINCGARSCASCRRCYSRKTAVNVNEKLK